MKIDLWLPSPRRLRRWDAGGGLGVRALSRTGSLFSEEEVTERNNRRGAAGDLVSPTFDYRLWTIDYGLLTIDYGLLTIDYGLLTIDYGLLTIDYRPLTLSLVNLPAAG
jgi:hypothetical protein